MDYLRARRFISLGLAAAAVQTPLADHVRSKRYLFELLRPALLVVCLGQEGGPFARWSKHLAVLGFHMRQPQLLPFCKIIIVGTPAGTFNLFSNLTTKNNIEEENLGSIKFSAAKEGQPGSSRSLWNWATERDRSLTAVFGSEVPSLY